MKISKLIFSYFLKYLTNQTGANPKAKVRSITEVFTKFQGKIHQLIPSRTPRQMVKTAKPMVWFNEFEELKYHFKPAKLH